MSTTATIVNLHRPTLPPSTLNVAVVSCATGKKMFSNRKEAEEFEATNRSQFHRPPQYAYECSQCASYHLSSKPPDAFACGPSNIKRLEYLAPANSRTSNLRPRGETEAQVRQLHEQGLNNGAIASKLGITRAAVAYHKNKIAGITPKGSGTVRPLLTQPDLDEQRRKLQNQYEADMRMLDQRQQWIAEANKLSISECQDGKALFLKYGHHERMSIPKDKVAELADSLRPLVI